MYCTYTVRKSNSFATEVTSVKNVNEDSLLLAFRQRTALGEDGKKHFLPIYNSHVNAEKAVLSLLKTH